MKRLKFIGSGSHACSANRHFPAAGLRHGWGNGSARRGFTLALAAVCLAVMPVDWHPQFRLATGLSALAQQPGANPNDEDEEEKEDTRPLYQREPFDLVTLKQADGGDVIKVMPVKRPVPRNPSGTATLQVSRFDQRNRKYEIAWRSIDSVKLFEELVLDEAEELVKQQKFDEAYPYLAFLLKYHAGMPRLEDSVNHFLLSNAVASFREKKYIEMFSMLEELHKSSPRYQTVAVMRGLDQAAGALLKQHMDAGNIAAAQMLLARLESTYKDADLPAIVTWRGELSRLAAVKRDAAKQAIADDKMREAYKFVQEMMRIYPKVPGGPELAQQVANKYPMAYVGVTQPATVFEPSRIENWSARRSGRLLNRMLLEFRQPGGEGGEYSFPLGTISISEDRQQLMLRVASSINGVPTPLSGYEVSRRLIELATIGHPDYTPSWASLVSDVHVSNVFDVYVDFRRPHVLPQAMLLTRFDTVGGWVTPT